MAYENAVRILKDSEAKITQSAEGIYDSNVVILFWDNIEARRINECVNYLNSPEQQIVSGPVTFYDVPFSDDLYHLHAYYSEEDQRIYRVLMRDPIQSSSFSEQETKWKLFTGERYQTGLASIVIGMNNVDPSFALQFQEEALDDSYIDTIYLLRSVPLDGEWHSIRRETLEDPKTGLYTIRWYLSRTSTGAMGFKYNADYNTILTEINIVDIGDAEKDDFYANTYIDDKGDWYYSSDGANATKKNGDTIDSEALDASAARIDESVYGRQITIRSFFDEREKNWNLMLQVKQSVGDNTLSTVGANDSAIVVANSLDKVTTREQGSGVSIEAITELRAKYDNTPASGTTQNLEIKLNDDGSYDYVGVIMTTTGTIETTILGKHKHFYGSGAPLPPSTDPDCNLPAGDDEFIYVNTNSARVISEVVSFNKENSTWDWKIVTTTEGMGDQYYSYSDGKGTKLKVYLDGLTTGEIRDALTSYGVDISNGDFLVFGVYDVNGNDELWVTKVNGQAYLALPTESQFQLKSLPSGVTLVTTEHRVQSTGDVNLSIEVMIGESQDFFSRAEGVTAELDKRISINETTNKATKKEYGFSVTLAELDAARALYEGTAASAGTFIKFDFSQNQDSTYNYIGLTTTTLGDIASMVIGEKVVNTGWHTALPPSTDPTCNDAAGDDEFVYVDIGDVFVINESVSFNESDSTWSWIIVTSIENSGIQQTFYSATPATNILDYRLQKLNPDQLLHLQNKTYFDDNGTVYKRTVGFTSRVEIHKPDGTVTYDYAFTPSTYNAHLISESAEGRKIGISEDYDEKTGLVDVHIKIETQEGRNASVYTKHASNQTKEVVLELYGLTAEEANLGSWQISLDEYGLYYTCIDRDAQNPDYTFINGIATNARPLSPWVSSSNWSLPISDVLLTTTIGKFIPAKAETSITKNHADDSYILKIVGKFCSPLLTNQSVHKRGIAETVVTATMVHPVGRKSIFFQNHMIGRDGKIYYASLIHAEPNSYQYFDTITHELAYPNSANYKRVNDATPGREVSVTTQQIDLSFYRTTVVVSYSDEAVSGSDSVPIITVGSATHKRRFMKHVESQTLPVNADLSGRLEPLKLMGGEFIDTNQLNSIKLEGISPENNGIWRNTGIDTNGYGIWKLSTKEGELSYDGVGGYWLLVYRDEADDDTAVSWVNHSKIKIGGDGYPPSVGWMPFSYQSLGNLSITRYDTTEAISLPFLGFDKYGHPSWGETNNQENNKVYRDPDANFDWKAIIDGTHIFSSQDNRDGIFPSTGTWTPSLPSISTVTISGTNSAVDGEWVLLNDSGISSVWTKDDLSETATPKIFMRTGKFDGSTVQGRWEIFAPGVGGQWINENLVDTENLTTQSFPPRTGWIKTPRCHESLTTLPVLSYDQALYQRSEPGPTMVMEADGDVEIASVSPTVSTLLEYELLHGRKMVTTKIENAQVMNGMFHYDLYEEEVIAPINKGDAWFFAARDVRTETEEIRFWTKVRASFRSAVMQSSTKVDVLTCPRWRPIITEVYRKYFLRQPTTEDLATIVHRGGLVAPMTDIGITESFTTGRSGDIYYIEKTRRNVYPWKGYPASALNFTITPIVAKSNYTSAGGINNSSSPGSLLSGGLTMSGVNEKPPYIPPAASNTNGGVKYHQTGYSQATLKKIWNASSIGSVARTNAAGDIIAIW